MTRLLRKTVIDQFTRERQSADENGSGQPQASKNGPAPSSLPDGAAASIPDSDGAHDERILKAGGIPVWKRLLDCTLIALTWPLWLPVMLLIMVAIKLGSRGPVFYRQERVGFRARRFMVFKFRTMKVNVETQTHESYLERLMLTDAPMVKLDAKGDSRLIRFGRFLRAAGLDELPQLFNVWNGEMSLVGPRPCTVHEFSCYRPWQRERVNAPPGMTGFWQVNGKNSTTFSEMIDMDILYGNNMSFKLDLLILAKTFPAILEQLLETWGLNRPAFRKRDLGHARMPFVNSPSQ